MLAGLLWVAMAWADIAPIYPEPACDPATNCPGGRGVTCSTSFDAPDACQVWGTRGYTFACRSGGASVWSEVWCGGEVAPAAPEAGKEPIPEVPPELPVKTGRGCAQGAAGSVSLGLGLAGVALLIRRRGQAAA
jgi:hypothetical protein